MQDELNKRKGCFFNSIQKEELEKLHTKQLLNMLRQTNRIHFYEYCCDCEDYYNCKKNYTKYISMLKEILATRPHIPNKKESKAIRIAKIKKGK